MRILRSMPNGLIEVWVLWAPSPWSFAQRRGTAFYLHLGWRVAEAPIWCEQPGGPVRLAHELALYLACQGDADWPRGPIHLRGAPW
jgi:hypothetical protein